jgi:hypothetical protein
MRWGGGKIKTSLRWALVLIWVLVGWKFVGLSIFWKLYRSTLSKWAALMAHLKPSCLGNPISLPEGR